MKILLNKVHSPVTVLGYGRRIGIWFQGCNIHCSGCCSLDTWTFDDSKAIEVEAILDWCKEISAVGIDGVTITGGEPFDQPDGLLKLLEGLVSWRETQGVDLDLLVYSGYTMRNIEKKYSRHLPLIDAIVAGPFLTNRPTEKSYCGSDNQRRICFTARGRERYESQDGTMASGGIQVAIDTEGVWFVGIPRQGDLDRIDEECRKRGVILQGTSWRC